MSDRAKKVTELTEVTSITPSDTLLYVVVGANSTPASRKVKVSNLLSNLSLTSASITTLTSNTINVVQVGNTSTTVVSNNITVATGISLSQNAVPNITIANGHPWIVAYGNGVHNGTEITWTNAVTANLIYDNAVTTHTAYIASSGFYIDLDYNDANTGYVGWAFNSNGSISFPDGSIQNKAFSDVVYNIKVGGVYDTFVSGSGATFNGAYGMNCAVTSTVFAKTPLNFFGLDLLNFSLAPGETTVITAVISQNSSPNLPQNLYFGNATPVTVKWKGGSIPSPNANKVDVIEYFILNDAGTYTVLAELTTYG